MAYVYKTKLIFSVCSGQKMVGQYNKLCLWALKKRGVYQNLSLFKKDDGIFFSWNCYYIPVFHVVLSHEVEVVHCEIHSF